LRILGPLRVLRVLRVLRGLRTLRVLRVLGALRILRLWGAQNSGAKAAGGVPELEPQIQGNKTPTTLSTQVTLG
jgi:hypothetical protein